MKWIQTARIFYVFFNVWLPLSPAGFFSVSLFLYICLSLSLKLYFIPYTWLSYHYYDRFAHVDLHPHLGCFYPRWLWNVVIIIKCVIQISIAKINKLFFLNYKMIFYNAYNDLSFSGYSFVCLVAWFYGMIILVGLFNAKVDLFCP